jgi:hypothetical protein
MAYVPELYVEATVDAFHALRRGDPPFTPAGAGGAGSPSYAGLGDIITFLVSHFNDARIVNPDVRDVLLQSISVLLQYKARSVPPTCPNAPLSLRLWPVPSVVCYVWLCIHSSEPWPDPWTPSQTPLHQL